MPPLKTQIRAVAGSWRNQTLAVRVIRLWLGTTWIYAGWNKATDPGFLSKTGGDYIGKQLTGYAHNSPLGFLFRHLIERATIVGILVTISEFAIGLATLFWIAPTMMAFIGFTMSFGLWLAATWHVKPYFLGSDSVYAVLWLSYLLTLIGKRRKADISIDRRGALRVGALAVAAAAATFAGNIFFKPSTANSVGTAVGSLTFRRSSNQVIKLSNLAIGQTHEFATSDGQPAILFRTKDGVFAYSEVCTHQGCTVAYSPADKLLSCPCHGGAYDPFNNAKVVGGPPPAPLPPVKVAIRGDWIVVA
jgi:thiosulfate dehydrogenase [quinone] large subunit